MCARDVLRIGVMISDVNISWIATLNILFLRVQNCRKEIDDVFVAKNVIYTIDLGYVYVISFCICNKRLDVFNCQK